MSAKTAAPTTNKLAIAMAWVALAIIFLLPFHALITTWVMSNIGYADQLRVWKEAVIGVLIVGCTILLVRDRQLRQQFLHSKLTMLIGLYVVLGLLRTVYGWQQGIVTSESAAYGMVGAFRYFVFFLVVSLIVARSQAMQQWWKFAVVTPATIVIIYGLLQQFVLDKNFLAHFGYGPDTIPAYQSVDQKTQYARAQSLLRGPNPLGAYLSMIITFLTGMWYKFKSSRFSFGLLIVAANVLLFFSYSRSAWLGLAVSLATWIILVIKDKKVLKQLLVAGVVAGVICMVAIFGLRDNNYVQNTVFHTDETSASASSTNSVRWQAIIDGVKDVVQHPLGQGLGSAGPASARGPSPKIAENYYIQVAQEVGIFGLVLYLAITAGVGYRLFERRDELLAQVLFASLVGVTVINLMSHAWMDDTLSLMWWGLAGVALAPAIISHKHEKQTKNEKLAR